MRWWKLVTDLILIALLAGCKDTVIVNPRECGTGNPLDFVKGPEYANPRFEISSGSAVRPSRDFWVRKGDLLAMKWDNARFVINRAGSLCDPNLPCSEQTEACHRCDSCANSCEFSDPSWCAIYYDFERDSLDYFLKVAEFEGFVRDAAPARVIAFPPLDICPSTNPGDAPTFSPQRNATLQMFHRSFAACNTPEDFDHATVIAESKVFVVEDGMTQAATYQLTAHTDPRNPALTFRKWTMEGTPKFNENFSSNLRIGRVRVFTGTPGTDPVTGQFRLENPAVVRPSRVVLSQNFVAGQSVFDNDRRRCYSDAKAEDGDIDLTQCRVVFGGAAAGPENATPTYLGGFSQD